MTSGYGVASATRRTPRWRSDRKLVPAGTRTPTGITVRPADPDERGGGHAQPAAGLEARQRSMGAHPDRADGVVRQVAQQQADPDGARLDKTPVVVEGLEDDRVRLRGHADVAEPGGGQHVLEPAGLAEAGAAHDLVTALRKALQQLGGQRPEPGYALGAGPHEACEDAARMQRAPAFADAGDRVGKG